MPQETDRTPRKWRWRVTFNDGREQIVEGIHERQVWERYTRTQTRRFHPVSVERLESASGR